MKVTHDFHIHTDLSICANETATLDNYIGIAKKLGLKKIGISNHFWDSKIPGVNEFYDIQDYDHVAQIRPEIDKANAKEDIKIYFGCECEYDPVHRDVAVTEETAEKFEYILIPNSHTHLTMPREYYEPYQKHIDFMIQGYEDIINSKVSKYITAVAHPFCAICCPYDREILINMIPDDTFKRLFDQTANKGIAFELNVDYMAKYKKSYEEIAEAAHIRMFRLAKEMGCKFIFGSDAHSTTEHETYEQLTQAFVELLDLKETDLADIAK